MRYGSKVGLALLLWVASTLTYGLCLLVLPHWEVPFSLFLNFSLQTLLSCLCFLIAVYEPVVKNKYIFVNLGLFFATAVPAHVGNFLGFPDDGLPKFLIDQYVSYGAYYAFMALAIVYLTLDAVFRHWRTLYKYLVTLAIVGVIIAYYYAPMLADPQYAYKTHDVLDWKTLDQASSALSIKLGRPPTIDELQSAVSMDTWNGRTAKEQLASNDSRSRIEYIYPYLSGDNYIVLVCKPMMMNSIFVSVFSIGFILLFFGHQYMKDPPQGAYIEKVVFVMLVFCTIEIFHAWSAIKILEWDMMSTMLEVGQYISVALLLVLVFFLLLRLKFITSAKGEFYEQELATHPAGITRWRDSLDNIVIEKFLNRNALLGRFFVDPRIQTATKRQRNAANQHITGSL